MSRLRTLTFRGRLGTSLLILALAALALQASVVIANAGNVRPVFQPIHPLQDYGGGGGSPPAAPPAAPPPAQLTEPGLKDNVSVTGVQTTTTSSTQQSTVSTTTTTGTATVQVPPAALPSGATVQVAAITNPADLIAAAPPPKDVVPIAAFQISASTASGAAVTDNFTTPVQVEFEVSAAALPPGANEGNVAVAFWNGSDWVVTDATITKNADGSLNVSASVTHFTLFSVLKQPDIAYSGAFPTTPGGFSLMVWNGLTGTSASAATRLLPQTPAAIFALDTARQRFLAYLPLAPAGVSDVFTLTSGQALIVKSTGTAPGTAAAPASTPGAAPASNAAPGTRRSVVVQPGDSLYTIGIKNGVDWTKLAAINGLPNGDLIKPGQTIYLE